MALVLLIVVLIAAAVIMFWPKDKADQPSNSPEKPGDGIGTTPAPLPEADREANLLALSERFFEAIGERPLDKKLEETPIVHDTLVVKRISYIASAPLSETIPSSRGFSAPQSRASLASSARSHPQQRET